ncbi:MAG: glycerol-3-phosphate acyltransferase, partial [Clostridia bacterium]|nr:glycerol-3-phosphate acyltransferase [Clostridia bacterium]
GDLIKGAGAVLLGRAIGGQEAAYCAALGVVIGHCWPVFFRFKGGKGVASSLGAAVLLNPLWGFVAGVAGIVVAAITRKISPASLTGFTVYLIIALIYGNTMWDKISAILLFAIVVYRHRENIARLIHGEESAVFERRDKESK